MRGGSGLALAYVLGLFALAATRRREGLQRVLQRVTPRVTHRVTRCGLSSPIAGLVGG